ncbi:Hypothetical predicted protein [Podarcis lilfordi]|uniref:Uncharacterized protein n=1 Tax=Podarcis lilfordi TaxID=74358 RepID=A0AA35K3J0_9SAUR|nr:Hypothetical predicted protein [Podarcis lilfordi]
MSLQGKVCSLSVFGCKSLCCPGQDKATKKFNKVHRKWRKCIVKRVWASSTITYGEAQCVRLVCLDVGLSKLSPPSLCQINEKNSTVKLSGHFKKTVLFP